MKIGITHFDVKPGKLGEFKKLWEQHLGGMKQEAKGYQTAVLFSNPNTGKCHSVGFYDSEESAKSASSVSAYQKLVSGARDLLTAQPSRELDDITGEAELFSGVKKVA